MMYPSKIMHWNVEQYSAVNAYPVDLEVYCEERSINEFISDHFHDDYHDTLKACELVDEFYATVRDESNHVIVARSSKVGPYVGSIFVDRSGPVWVLHYLYAPREDKVNRMPIRRALLNRAIRDAMRHGLASLIFSCRLALVEEDGLLFQMYKQFGFEPVEESRMKHKKVAQFVPIVNLV